MKFQRSSQANIFLGILCVTLFSLCFLSCKGCRRSASLITEQPKNQNEFVFLDNPISFCSQRSLKQIDERVQVLVDASGSMIGFQHIAPRLVGWIEHGVSQLRTTINIVDYRLCQFSGPEGIFKSTKWGQPMADYRPFGSTNLHDAINSANSYGVTFILTDGVAATGPGGGVDCATGVDAACVARKLREVVHGDASYGNEIKRGIWIIPLIAAYNGQFFTEEIISPSTFDPNETIRQIRSEVDIQAVIQNPRTDSEGKLVFGYDGPRALLLIVIADDANTGRVTVQSLWENLVGTGIERAENIKQGFTSNPSCLLPIELYPGYLNPVRWEKLREPDQPGQLHGTIDAFLEATSRSATISLMCPKGQTGEGIYTLQGSTQFEKQATGCNKLIVLPALSFEMQPLRREDESALPYFLKNVQRVEGSYFDLQLDLTCNSEHPRYCNENPIPVQWVAYMHYSQSGDCLASGKCNHNSHELIRSLSTSTPSKQPHRIFNLSVIIERFYQEVANDQKSIVLSELQFCTTR